ncbi:DUF7284 family protein [Halobaculum gomorrense]|uniref:Uncharacterized protein n=1 Tax=Halobaculum gomorrense TaxID=43928 RepID=A0A1M5TKY6_9EURY|nr:hypothetical protein [Halobaculum gomorrense]SHH51475.1 hypothetical protein SAMN05443636_2753 [Halobaculum gomorrense]
MTGSLLDVCLALLLVSAAAGTLAATDDAAKTAPHAAESRASETAATLATTTASVEYTIVAAEGTTGPDDAAASPEADRIAHGTLGEHLARAVTRSATIDDTALSPAVGDYRRGVRRAVADAVGSRTAIRAVWRPLPCAGLGATVRVGPRPPPTVTVRAARFSVPVGASSVPAASESDTEDGATTAASRAVAVLFPPDRIAAAARGDPIASAAVTDRYRRAGRATGVDAIARLKRGGPRSANRALAAALAADAEAGAAAESPAGERDACGSGDPTRVTIVVRTWSP